MEFNLHDVEWDDEKVTRFWNGFSKLPHIQYFGEQAGQSILRIAKRYIDLNDEIIDYGSGKGSMIGYLLQAGAVHVSGCDFSDDSVQLVQAKYKSVSGFKGCSKIDSLPSQLPPAYYGTVFFMETIEHLLEPHYEPTLSEISRIIKRGGYVLITTRNEENLDNLKVICPDCGAMFHRVQHVRSFSKYSLSSEMDKFGFDKVICESRQFTRNYWSGKAFELYRKVRRIEHFNPNLIYLGKKR